MTPYAFAQAECANMTAEGGCLALPGEAPCVLKRGQDRCPYFEAHVLPIADQETKRPKLQAARLAARRAYLAHFPADEAAPDADPAERLCPDCGKPLAKGAQVCPECRRRRRQATKRRSMREWRKRRRAGNGR